MTRASAREERRRLHARRVASLGITRGERHSHVTVERVVQESGGEKRAYGESAASITVRALPPRESLSNHVSTESRYGTTSAAAAAGLPPPIDAVAAPFAGVVSALITLPSAESERLMLDASLSRSPTAPVASARSEPMRERGKEGGPIYRRKNARRQESYAPD